MDSKAPTYHLGPEFSSKLDQFVVDFLNNGYQMFDQELQPVADYVAAARASDCPEKLRQTPKEKYLLELISFGVLDRLNREAFNRTQKTLIVMPDCLSLDNPDCEKVAHDFGELCRRCTEGCQAYNLVGLARKYGATPVFAKRTQKEQLEHWVKRLGGDVGALGVACINMLADGMRVAGEIGIPARGVLLNFSGCEHWQDQPCASEFALNWLEAVLKEKHGSRD